MTESKKRKVKVFLTKNHELMLTVISKFLSQKTQIKDKNGKDTPITVLVDMKNDSDQLLLYALEETAKFIVDVHTRARALQQEKKNKEALLDANKFTP